MSLTEILLPFGVREGSLVHISEVERGKACGCLCPACGDKLVAKKGRVQQHHFAHLAGADCRSSVESALHFAAKEILDRSSKVSLPAVKVNFPGGKAPIEIAPEQDYKMSDVRLERKLGSVVPDVTVQIRGRELAIEIYVTHKVDDEKVDRFRSLGLSAIEIDLSGFGRVFDVDDLERLILGPGSQKRWVYNSVVEHRKRIAWSNSRSLPTAFRGFAIHVDNCPIAARVYKGKPYANLMHDCNGCPHCIEIGSDTNSVQCDGLAI